MCGIVGILHNNANVISLTSLKTMTDVIAHRGPDGEGHWISDSGTVGLGHRRLSIIDLSATGKQPMHYADNRYTITFNGEIYNYIELRNRLIKKGLEFQGTSDTEVLLALYHVEKEKCLDYLDGMFAFAIWDNKEQELFFARDRFGEKPFHYAYKKGEYFIFGSEMKSLWAISHPRSVNKKMLYRYLAYGEIMSGDDLSETFYENISRLEPAHYGKISIRNLQLEIKPYWKLNYQDINDQINEEYAIGKFRELFTESVKRRLRSDVPVGSSLSGGLDSSLIVCVINDLNAGNVKQHTFSARFPGFKKDEGEYMNMVIDRVHPSPHFVFPDEHVFFQQMAEIAWHQEEPFGSASINTQNAVMRLAKEEGITVLLDGQGADEILAGYHTYYQPFFRELKAKDSRAYKNQVENYQKLHAENSINGILFQDGFRSRVKGSLPEPLFRLMRDVKGRISAIRYPFISRDYTASYNVKESQKLLPNQFLNQSLYTSTTGRGLQELLRFADRNSMQHSREVRLPFLSHELVEFVFTLPARFKIFDGWTKYLLRKSFCDILPSEISWRKDKIGYESPQQSWMNNKEVKAQVRAYKSDLISAGILDASLLNRDIEEGTSIFTDKNWRILQVGLNFKV